METRKYIDDVLLYCCYRINSLFALIISISLDLILIQRHQCIYILVFHLTMLLYDFNFSLLQFRHDDKDTQVKKAYDIQEHFE